MSCLLGTRGWGGGGGGLKARPVVVVKCCFTSTETVGLVRDGSPGRPPSRLSHITARPRAPRLNPEDGRDAAWTTAATEMSPIA